MSTAPISHSISSSNSMMLSCHARGGSSGKRLKFSGIGRTVEESTSIIVKESLRLTWNMPEHWKLSLVGLMRYHSPGVYGIHVVSKNQGTHSPRSILRAQALACSSRPRAGYSTDL